MPFSNAEESHNHSALTLETLYEFDDFMESVGTVCDMGGGAGLDALWWSTRTVREDKPKPEPLNIKSTVVDIKDTFDVKHENVNFVQADFEETGLKEKFDVITSHDSFQYALNPVKTLAHWWELANPNAMLVLQVPQTTNLKYNRQNFTNESFVYNHYTLVNLIHMLAINGWDCDDAYFYKKINDPWIRIVCFKSNITPMDPRTTTWYDLVDQKLLPNSAVASINKWGMLRQEDLQLFWIDRSLETFLNH
jgi:hypothetical protein